MHTSPPTWTHFLPSGSVIPLISAAPSALMGIPGLQLLPAGIGTMTPETPMHSPPIWDVDQMKILTRTELARVLADAKRQATRSANARRNLIVVRLACCCGLRVSEIAGLSMTDVVVDGQRPHLRLPKAITKGKKAAWSRSGGTPTR